MAEWAAVWSRMIRLFSLFHVYMYVLSRHWARHSKHRSQQGTWGPSPESCLHSPLSQDTFVLRNTVPTRISSFCHHASGKQAEQW